MPSPSSIVAVVGDETPIDFRSRTKTPSPTKKPAGSAESSPNSEQDVAVADRLHPNSNIKRKASPQDRQLPMSRPISPFDNENSLKSTASNGSIASTASSITRKPRPTPIQIPATMLQSD